ncbi:uncharacterized protein LOC114535118 [Dendronephthya gigantea]|uniref:uncharacterized protein LOC114535118 n=1 Tax=Dendronephthya gigantea TaxID=151771 RepID=UPI001069923A|nr:uncharacterized protein LOC114535118 [Dendronephthya gigantea]
MLYACLVVLYFMPSVYGWYMPQTHPPYDPKEARMVKCPKYNLSKLGCHNARDPSKPYLPRAVPELILTTDSSSGKYVGYQRATFPSYHDFLARFICDCAEKIRGKGFTHFSISNYFQCWSGKNVGKTYDLYKPADGCVRGDKRHCDTNNLGLCAGAGGLHFVYTLKSPNPTALTTTAITTSIVTQSTTTLATPFSGLSVKCGNTVYKLRKLGCWNEKDKTKAFPELMLTAVDHYNQRLYAGYYLDTKDYGTFLKRFVCDCASKTSTKGYSIFGVRKYGECWSGPKVACTYHQHGKANDCINQKKWKCSDSSSMLCASPNSQSMYAFVLADSKDDTQCGEKSTTEAQTTQKVTPITTPKTTPKVVPSSRTTLPATTGKPQVTCGNLKYKLVKLGCWNELGDFTPPRAMPELLLTARDKSSRVYAGYEFNRHNYAAFLERFICDCVSKIKEKGYSVFGLQFYGECWSGPTVGCTYQKFGEINGCVNQNMATCSDDSTMLCSGNNAKHTYVYVLDDHQAICPTNTPSEPQSTPKVVSTPKVTPRITHKIPSSPQTTPKFPTSPKVTTPLHKGPPVVKCGNVEYKLKKLGCWNELGDSQPPRAMPELILTSRDRQSRAYVGYDFNRHTYAAFLERFICDCVKKINQKGYSIFGLQFYGECWSGPKAGCTYQKFGQTDGCVNQNMATCSDDSTMLCSGDNAKHAYVYAPVDTPDAALCPGEPKTTPKVTFKTTRKIITKPKTTPKVITTPRTTLRTTTPTKKITTPTEKITTPTDKITTPKTTPIPTGPARIKCGNIEYKLTKLGCWKEFGHVRPPRILPELLLTAKDKTSSVYAGYEFYTQKYEDFIKRFVCDCVSKVKRKGYSVFGVQYYGECWSGLRAACSYKTFGKSYKCVNEKLGKCLDKSSRLCSGENREDTYVYIPADTPGGLTCPTTLPTTPKTTPKITTLTKKITTPTKNITTPTDKITTPTDKITTPKTTPIPTGPARIKCKNIEYKLIKLGCWKEFGHVRPPRILPELLLTAKDKTSSVYAGYEFYTQKYEDFIKRFLCDCVSKVKRKGYSVFGVQYYGECWSGPRAACSYKTFGKSYKCVNEKLGKCLDKSSRLCSGENREDTYVYIPADTPGGLTCPTTIPTTPTTTPKITTPTKKITTPTKKITTPTDKITTPKTTPIPTGPARIKCKNIEYKLTKLGCWKEFGHVRPPRILPELLLTAKDKTSSVYAGYEFYTQKYEDFIKRFVCDCVSKVKRKGYSVFGVQYYGECWSGPRAACSYKTFGKSYNCVNEKLGKCLDKSSRLCSGQNEEDIYVYIPADTPGGLMCPTTLPTTPTTTPKITTPTKKITTPTKKITTPTDKITTPTPTGPPIIKCGSVQYKLTKLGCWKDLGDINPPRAMPELLLTARDKWSSVYAGYDYHKMGYDIFIKKFICDCVKKVQKKSYSVFGLQFYGECWSGPKVGCTFKKFGRANECVNEKLGQCSDTTSRFCAGHSSQEMYVYVPYYPPPSELCPSTTPTSITTVSTPVPPGPPRLKCGNVEYKLTKLGCWKELGDTMPPRAINELLLTARDKKSSVYAGYDFDKQNFEDFIQKFACDCVKEVKQKGYSVFGLQFYGECWSGDRVACTYKKFGQSNGCINEKLNQCSDKSSQICSGHSSQEIYVYVPSNLPATCPTTSPITTTSTASVTLPSPSVILPTSTVTPSTSSATPRTSSVTPTTPSVTPTNPTVKCNNVEYKLRKLGCWSQRSSNDMPRAIPELLLTARDSKSKVYAGYQIDTTNYAQFLNEFICDCISKVDTKGYSVFGLQFYGECWSGPRAQCTYERYGQSKSCMNEKKSACSDKSSMLCSGDSPRNVYVFVRADKALPTCPSISTVSTRSTPPAPTTALTVSPTTPKTPPPSPSRTSTATPSVTVPTPTPNIPIGFECKKALDIVIAIDSSGSVMKGPYNRIKTFVSKTTTRFTSFKPTYFGLIHYNYRVIKSATLKDQIPNSRTLRNRIRDMGYLDKATLTQAALTTADRLFVEGARSDSDVQKILVLFTDGRTYGGKKTLREPLKKLRDSGVRVIAVAVGRKDYLDRYALLLIAKDQSNLLIIPTLEDLGKVDRYVDKVAYMICPK